MSRFFVEGRREIGDVVALDGSDAHKIVSVLRMSDGDSIEVIDSAAQHFQAHVRVNRSNVTAILVNALERMETVEPRITVAQSLPKAQKMDFVVEKLTELGVASIVPLQTERTIPATTGSGKLLRWRRLAKSAAQQCGRSRIPTVTDVQTFAQIIDEFRQYDCVLLPWELADRTPLRDRLPALLAQSKNVLVIIGPEGGFSHAETQAATKAGAQLISLGSRILRTETAGLVIVALIGYILSDA